jgi:hypothetical protein
MLRFVTAKERALPTGHEALSAPTVPREGDGGAETRGIFIPM